MEWAWAEWAWGVCHSDTEPKAVESIEISVASSCKYTQLISRKDQQIYGVGGPTIVLIILKREVI